MAQAVTEWDRIMEDICCCTREEALAALRTRSLDYIHVMTGLCIGPCAAAHHTSDWYCDRRRWEVYIKWKGYIRPT